MYLPFLSLTIRPSCSKDFKELSTVAFVIFTESPKTFCKDFFNAFLLILPFTIRSSIAIAACLFLTLSASSFCCVSIGFCLPISLCAALAPITSFNSSIETSALRSIPSIDLRLAILSASCFGKFCKDIPEKGWFVSLAAAIIADAFCSPLVLSSSIDSGTTDFSIFSVGLCSSFSATGFNDLE